MLLPPELPEPGVVPGPEPPKRKVAGCRILCGMAEMTTVLGVVRGAWSVVRGDGNWERESG
jgi:hypothetical protein